MRRAVRCHRLWQPGDRVLVACSGGLDSVTALDILLRLRPSLGHELAVAHVDHGLRPASAEDASFVADLAASGGLPFAGRRLEMEPGPGLQGRARTLRYEALHELAADLRCHRIVTAHHADDQAETLLMRAARGAGVTGLAGIGRRRGDVVRPLLDLSRAELHAHANRHGLRWREDPSNRLADYERNRLRHELLPLLETIRPGAARGLARTAENAASDGAAARCWARVAIELLGRVERRGEAIELRFPRRRIPPSVGAVGAWLAAATESLGGDHPGRRAVEQIHLTLATADRSPVRCQLHGIAVEVTEAEVLLRRGEIARPPGAD